MAFVNGFDNDVFVSYAHADDEVDALGDAWVHLFVQDLLTALKQRLGRGDELKIYFDSRRLQGNHPLDDILHNVRDSALFLAVGSPSYVNRPWTRDELSTFVASCDDRARLFAIERLPLDVEDRWPDPLNDYFRLGFWLRDQESDVPLTLTRKMKGDLYLIKVQKLAEQIRGQLLAMHLRAEKAAASPVHTLMGNAATNGNGSAASAPVATVPAAAANGIRPVLVAQVTEDLETEREQLITALQQYAVPILPVEMYPQGGSEFRAAVEADLANSALFVQLLGKSLGRRPPDLPEGYLLAQHDLATKAGIKTVQWREPTLNLTLIKDDGHRALLSGKTVAAVGFESFKNDVIKIATTPPPPPPPPPPDPSLIDTGPIFINADANDLALAEPFYAKVAQRAVAILAQPNGPAEDVRREFEDNWRECGAVVMFYGQPESLFWVRRQLMLYNKLRPQRSQPPRKFKILNCPPKDKPPLGMGMPGVVEEDLREGLSPETMDKVVSDLLS